MRLGAEPLVGSSVATLLAITALVVSTGALHQDGLADTADGLGVRGDRERRLAVMRDPATGAFGTLAVLGWALLLLGALESLDAGHAFAALVSAAALARWAALLHAAGAPPARADGLGAGFRVSPLALALSGAVAIGVAVLACGPIAGVVALVATVAVTLLSVALARRALGGRTGDTIGATVSAAEVSVCTVLLAMWL